MGVLPILALCDKPKTFNVIVGLLSAAVVEFRAFRSGWWPFSLRTLIPLNILEIQKSFPTLYSHANNRVTLCDSSPVSCSCAVEIQACGVPNVITQQPASSQHRSDMARSFLIR
jgi:hypothetical protein